MGRSRSHRALSASGIQATGQPSRVAELEAQLQATQRELEQSRLNHQEDSAGFAQALSRLAQSERALSQTRAKLVDAQAQAERAEAKTATLTLQLQQLRELAESLSRDSAAGTEECAKLSQALRSAEARADDLETRLAEAEAREREALLAAEDARDERAAACAELEALRRDGGDSSDAQRRLAAAEARLDTLTHERVRLLELLASLEVLGREITHLTLQATPEAPGLPKVEAWLGRDVEAEHVRATVRPEAMSAVPVQATRTWSTPEIVIDGVKIDS